MFFKDKMLWFAACSIIFGSSASSAGNLSLYSLIAGDNVGLPADVSVASEGMPALTSGDDNVAIGDEALNANTSGSSNTAIGDEALKSNTSGFKNTAIGKTHYTQIRMGNKTLLLGLKL